MKLLRKALSENYVNILLNEWVYRGLAVAENLI